MIRALIIMFCAAVLLADTADARRRYKVYKIVRKMPPPTEPELKSVRTIVIHCSDISLMFDEVWCHRVQRPFAWR